MGTVHAVSGSPGARHSVADSRGAHERWSVRGAVRALAMTLCACLLLSACAGPQERAGTAAPVAAERVRIAVFPLENLSGSGAPSREIRELFLARLQAAGFSVLDDDSLDRVMTRHRVRYTAGVDRDVALALKRDAAVEAILIPSLELFDETYPPKVAMFSRLISTGDSPAVMWIDGLGLAGDDAPGILGLGLVEDPSILVARAVDALVGSLVAEGFGARTHRADKGEPRKFRPKLVYRSDVLAPEKKYSVAVAPFFNKTDRKYAGEIIALHMIRNLMTFQNFEVVEPGIVRQELLRFRIIMTDGVSLPETETILGAVDADLVLNGEVLDYRDYRGPDGVAKVDFSVLFIERRTRQVVYSSYSQNQGDDGVLLFDWGRVNTAHAMASHMARAIGQKMLQAGQQAR
ncbi:MAG: putative lipoprotein [candidate division NC10 bacterium]|nr:putative lipoprotein [candidate division NC10 bacterium]